MRTDRTGQQRSSHCEALESRQMLSATLGTNLVRNGDAEASVGSSDGSAVEIPEWNADSGLITAVQYGATGGFPTANSPGPTSRGANFFAGGPDDTGNTLNTALQTIDISSLAADIDAGRIRYTFSGFLGGFAAENDEMDLNIFFGTDSDNITLDAQLKGPTAADRQNVTELLPETVARAVPAGSRVAVIEMSSTRASGAYNDGYADDISLTLSTTASTKTGFVSGQVFNDANGDGKKNVGEVGLAGIGVYADLNNNGTPDKGEPGAHTVSSGRYSISNVPKGNIALREILPKGFRGTTAVTKNITVNGGLTTIGQNFALSQTALIGGQVFADFNFDGKIDFDDPNLENLLIFLDANNNGTFDAGELSTRTTPSGNYRFTVPAGTYIIRARASRAEYQKAKPFVLTLGHGKTSIKNNFLLTPIPQ